MKDLLNITANEKLIAKVVTNLGEFEIELFPNKAPKTVENFAGLILKGYYDGVTFHRIIKGFVIQGGDPTGTGSGGNSYFGGDFEDEFHPELKHDAEGVLSMANRGPNTNSSQFFITLAPTPHLDNKHSVFGKVVSGIDIIRKIGDVQTSGYPSDKPIEPVIMEKVTVEKKSFN